MHGREWSKELELKFDFKLIKRNFKINEEQGNESYAFGASL